MLAAPFARHPAALLATPDGEIAPIHALVTRFCGVGHADSLKLAGVPTR